MKVFLSWSGDRSHKVAKVFRDWFPSVIQSIVPYVSSEDIDKGTRWSTDIAKELEDSTFGILCVTKENINAPWLTFEAGALSKTMDKSFVSPFLFDIKRSEVDGPILQFQSTVFQKNDIEKLVKTFNKACINDKLADDRLAKAFEVWYPTLEEELNKIKNIEIESPKKAKNDDETNGNELLEEILDLSRINQKVLRNKDADITNSIEEMTMRLNDMMRRIEKGTSTKISQRKMHPMIFEELLHMRRPGKNKYMGIKMILSLLRNDCPWIYDTGIEVIEVLKKSKNEKEKQEAINEFSEMIEFTSRHPLMKEFSQGNNERMLLREISMILRRNFEEII